MTKNDKYDFFKIKTFGLQTPLKSEEIMHKMRENIFLNIFIYYLF